MTSLLTVEALELSYGARPVLFGVDLEVCRGEAVVLLGTNGAGKTSLLKALCGLAPLRRGRVLVDGKDVTRLAAHRRAALGVHFVPAGPAFPSLTVEENLRLGAFTLRRDRRRTSAAIARALELFPALAARRRQRAGELSGGQHQMLNLARALTVEPRLLLIDELSLGLAPAVTEELLATIRRLAGEGTSALIVEQNATLAARVAERCYFLERGTIRFRGRSADLLARPDLLRSVFLGRAS